jgi:hypothetical protein
LEARGPTESEERRSGERPPQPEQEPRLIIEGAGGERVTVSGGDSLFDLVRRANAALLDTDPRKITTAWLARIEAIRDMIRDLAAGGDPKLVEARQTLAVAWDEMASVLRLIVPEHDIAPAMPDDIYNNDRDD